MIAPYRIYLIVDSFDQESRLRKVISGINRSVEYVVARSLADVMANLAGYPEYLRTPDAIFIVLNERTRLEKFVEILHADPKTQRTPKYIIRVVEHSFEALPIIDPHSATLGELEDEATSLLEILT